MEKTPDRPSKVRHKSVMVTTKSNNVVLQQLFFTMSVFCCRISSLFPLPLVFRAAHDNGTLQFNNFFKTYTCKFVLMRGENFDKIRLNPFQQK